MEGTRVGDSQEGRKKIREGNEKEKRKRKGGRERMGRITSLCG